jgi:hypothetical protein
VTISVIRQADPDVPTDIKQTLVTWLSAKGIRGSIMLCFHRGFLIPERTFHPTNTSTANAERSEIQCSRLCFWAPCSQKPQLRRQQWKGYAGQHPFDAASFEHTAGLSAPQYSISQSAMNTISTSNDNVESSDEDTEDDDEEEGDEESESEEDDSDDEDDPASQVRAIFAIAEPSGLVPAELEDNEPGMNEAS